MGEVSVRYAEKLAGLASRRQELNAEDAQNRRPEDGIPFTLAEKLTPCAGKCGAQLLPYSVWERLEKAQRKDLRRRGVNRQSSFGRCWKCTNEGKQKSEHGNAAVRRKISQQTRDKFPEMWQKIYENGGSYKQAAEVLGCTGEYVRQLVRDLGLPKPAGRANRVAVDYFLEELHHLVSFGLGAHEIAQKLGTTADALVQRIDKLRARGLTTVSFPQYFNYYEKEAA